ncbi:transcriptional regulator, LysR family [hydrothermal vent metagenome]|uniref:Transcriptional regulator, LysR family n=1 Tax=hydrothermal vent metagenome TaxID=652676 RepID=A0A1W1CL68_9ZZZZ
METILTKKSFRLGTTYIVGSYILPGKLNENINIATNSIVNVTISNCIDVIAKLQTKELDLGIIETPTFHKDIIAKEWIEDEMVICSNIELDSFVDKEELYKCKLICQKESSPINKLIHSFFKKINISHKNFHSISKIDNTTASIQSVKWSKPNPKHPTITIVSSRAIEDELKYKRVFMSRIKNYNMIRKLYIVYHKDIDIKKIEQIIKELMSYSS